MHTPAIFASFSPAPSSIEQWNGAETGNIIADLFDDGEVIVTADHGNDPVHSGWDHTREHVPVVIYGAEVKSVDMGVRESFADIGATICEILGAEGTSVGESFWNFIAGAENV